MPIDPALIQEIDHLRDLKEEERAALAERIELVSFGSGQIIFDRGDPGDALYIVRAGEVEIFLKNDQGEKIVLEISKPGDVFGEIALLDNGARTSSVAALGSVQVLRLDREHFEDYVRRYTSAALNLLSVTARRLRKTDDVIRRTVSRNANDVQAEQRSTLAELIAGLVSAWAGSLPSVVLHVAVFGIYTLVNLSFIKWVGVFDPYPFGLLSVVVGMECLFLAMFVLAAQNRQYRRDSIRSDVEFETNINAELKIAHLHEKIDRLTEDNSRIMVNVQKLLARQGA